MTFDLNSTIWLGYPIFAVLLYLTWHWAGTAIPPASMIDRNLLDNSVDQPELPTKPTASHGHPDAKNVGTVRIASNNMYIGPHFLETVHIRSLVLELYFSLSVLLALHVLSDTLLPAISELIVAHTYISIFVATIFVVPALLLGALRQFYGCLLSQAAALPVIDGSGYPGFCYLGDVPPLRWQHSPWFRAVTWIPVAVGSLIGAWIGALFVNQHFDVKVFYAICAFLGLRWLLSAIPVQLYRLTSMA
jgi:hypothetical protein